MSAQMVSVPTWSAVKVTEQTPSSPVSQLSAGLLPGGFGSLALPATK